MLSAYNLPSVVKNKVLSTNTRYFFAKKGAASAKIYACVVFSDTVFVSKIAAAFAKFKPHFVRKAVIMYSFVALVGVRFSISKLN